MTDHELLELAAKAARIPVEWNDELGEFTLNYLGGGFYEEWNPLTDDGDALRLAVKLRQTVALDDPDAARAGWTLFQTIAPTTDGRGPWYWKEWNADSQGDEYAATRRAIVNAAAAIWASPAKNPAEP